MKLRGLLVMCLVTALFFMAVISPLPAMARSSKSQIAFTQVDQVGAITLYLVNYDGTGRQTLVQETTGSFAWSPDGSRIAYATKDGIYTINADGSNPTRITGYKLPDSTLLDPSTIDSMDWLNRQEKYDTIVLHSYERSQAYPPSLANYFLFVSTQGSPDQGFADIVPLPCLNPDSTSYEPLSIDGWSDSAGMTSHSFAWSPDGSLVLIVSKGQIYACKLGQGILIHLTADARGLDDNPVWSSDMKFIAFDSTRDNIFDETPPDHRNDIFIMNHDGTNQRDLTFNFGVRGGIDAAISRDNSMEPTLSPDSKRIAFSTNHNTRHSIYMMNIDETGIYRLTDPIQEDPRAVAPERHWDDYDPVWSPDGNFISYIADRNIHLTVNVIDLRTGSIYHSIIGMGNPGDGKYAWQPVPHRSR